MNSDMAEFWLEHCPCGVMCLDEQGTVRYLNPALEKILGVPANQLLGRNRNNLIEPFPDGLFQGNGLLQLSGPELGRQRWLDCSEHKTDSGTSVVRFFLDVTELVGLRERTNKLEHQVEDLSITDELTGLANQRALTHALNTQVTRSRRYQNPLSLALVEVAHGSGNPTRLSDSEVLEASRYLRDRLRWVDVIARWDQNHFVIVLPETNLDQAVDLIAGISGGFTEVKASDAGIDGPLVMRYGIAEWLKGNDTRILMERAAESLRAFGPETPATPLN